MKNKAKRRKVIIGTVLAAAVCGIVAVVMAVTLGKDKANAGEKQQGQTAIPLSQMDLTKSVSATGELQSSSQKTVSAGVNGVKIKQVKVSVGERVKKGDVLVTFDTSDLQETLFEAKQNLSDAQSEAGRNLSRAKEQLSEAKKTYEKEKDKLRQQVSEAKKEWSEAEKEVVKLEKQKKAAKTSEQKAKCEEQLTKAEEMEKQAGNAYDTAVSAQENTNSQNKKNIETARDSVETAQSSQKKSVREAEKQVKEAEEALEQCAVTAPMDGVITAGNAEEGEVYDGGGMFQIEDTSGYVVSTTVDEYVISSIKLGQRVVMLTEATGEEELEGKITFVAPSAGKPALSAGNSSSTGVEESAQTSADGYEVEISLDTADERLKLGMTARCSIILEEAADVYAVPYDAVHENSDGTTSIFVSEAGKDAASAREVPVTKGMESDYYVEIRGDELREGLLVLLPTDETSADSETASDENRDSGQEVTDMFRGGGPGGSMPNENAPGSDSRPMGGHRND